MNKRAVILANGDPPSKKLLVRYLKSANLFICADGGANAAAKFNLRPDFIIGDLDSINRQAEKMFRHVKTRLIKDQNSTDLEKAFGYVIRNKFTEIFVLGATGGRIDHTIGNLSALIKFSWRADITFVQDDGLVLPIVWERKFDLPIGTIISLMPLTLCEGIVTTGLKWNLKNEILALGIQESTSNYAVISPVVVQVKRGNLVVFIANNSVYKKTSSH
jgi:thiamine pyrophosphokinase